MALRFSDFSHYSKYNGDLPGYDISGGEEVIYYWRSPYDPKLTYLHNISEDNDYFNAGTYGYGYYFASNTIGGGQGIRYPRFLHDGFWNDVYVERESANPWLVGGDDVTGSSTFGYLPAKPMKVGYGYGWWDDWIKYFSTLTGYTAINDLHQWPRKKILRHGRLYLQYEGGNGNSYYDSGKGINPVNGDLEATLFHYTKEAGEKLIDGDGFIMDASNDPEILIFDARYLPGTNESILRENETYVFNPSPVVGQDNRGSCGYPGAPLNRYGLNNMTNTTLPQVFGGDPQPPNQSYTIWGQARYSNHVGHCNTWGANFSVGNGQMIFQTAYDSAEIWGIDGQKNPLSHGTIGLELELTHRYGGFDLDISDQSSLNVVDYDEYRVEGAADSIVLKHDKMTVWTTEDYVNTSSDYHYLYVMNSDDSRLRVKIGNKANKHSQQMFAVGNGRLYTAMWHTNTNAGSSGLANQEGAMPYWYNTNYLRSNYSVQISDLGGVPRKKSFAPNGGTLLNLSAATGPAPVKAGFADRIVAGCGRVVFADTRYHQGNEGYYQYTSAYGKAWLYTQDGAFIKTLSFKDEGWGILYGAIGKDIRFGYKMEIANNLIFILAPKFDLSNWVTTNAGYQTWGGFGRMYIYSLDGELLAAFSGFNLGFSNSFPFNFDDFCTDGVDLFLFNNQDGVYAANHTTYGKQGHGIIWNDGTYYYTPGAGSLNNAGGSRVYAKNSRVLVTHIKLPETISNYYDKIAETYRY